MSTDRRTVIFNGFGILASIFILLSGQIAPRAIVDILVQVFGIVLIFWAVITIKVSREGHASHPFAGHFFIDKGPYEIIRHPIYAGYLLVIVSIVEQEFTFLRLVALAILCVCIMLKIIREESILAHEIPEYKQYQLKTKAIIPYFL